MDVLRATRPFRRCCGPRHSRGFTLTELMATVSVCSALSLCAVRFAGTVLDGMKLTAATHTLLAQLTHARSEAIKRNAPVVLCKSADGLRCAVDGGWEQGWLVFHDSNNNAQREEGEAVLVRGEPVPQLQINGNGTMARYVSFSPGGGTHTATGAFQAGTLTVCRPSAARAEARQIVINAAGRPRVQKVQLPSCAGA